MRKLYNIHEALVTKGHAVASITKDEVGTFSVILEPGALPADQIAADADLALELVKPRNMTPTEASFRLSLGQDNAAARAIVLAEVQRLAEERGA